MWNWLTRGSEGSNEEQGVSEVQGLVRGLNSHRAEPGPFFAKRVMAAIDATEADIIRRARAWAAVPSFASRLSAVAAILLVAAGSWLFSGGYRQSVLSGGIFEDSAAATASSTQDDVFTIPGEEAR